MVVSVGYQKREMRIELYVDRGNSASKILPVIEGSIKQPFKMPSITRKMIDNLDDGIKMEKTGKVYLCGDAALKAVSGSRYTPLDENDKIRDLSIVVATALTKVHPAGGPIELRVGVSSPIFHKGIEKQIYKELSKLEAGFSHDGKQYVVMIDKVGAFQEGVVFLESHAELNGVLDLGWGTFLAGVRHPELGVTPLPLSDGNSGGCNLILTSLLNDDRFLKAVKSAGFSAAPSPEKLSSLLGAGRWTVKDIDFRAFLKSHLKDTKQRIENAAQAIKTELKNASPYETVAPRIAFIGGGSCLLQGVLGDNLQKWCDRHCLVLFDDQPDYQTVRQMLAVYMADPSRMERVAVAVER